MTWLIAAKLLTSCFLWVTAFGFWGMAIWAVRNKKVKPAALFTLFGLALAAESAWFMHLMWGA